MPMKIPMKFASGPEAAALGLCAAAVAAGSAGSPLAVAAAGLAERDCASNSRRADAIAAHASGAVPGTPDPLPAPRMSNPNQPNRFVLNPATRPTDAGGFVMTAAAGCTAIAVGRTEIA